MRKFILLAGTATIAAASPAAACDLELLGGPQRFNIFASHASHAAATQLYEDSQSQTQATDTSDEPDEEVAASEAAPATSTAAEDAASGSQPSTKLP